MTPLYKMAGEQVGSSSEESSVASVAVCIVSYNTAALTTKAVETVVASQGVRCRVLIVDNGSSDRTVATLRRKFGLTEQKREWRACVDYALRPGQNELFPDVEQDLNQISSYWSASANDHEVSLLLSQKNLGFGRANNVAAAISAADYYVFLNSDTEVDPGAIAALVASFHSSTTPSSAVLARRRAALDNPGIVAAQLQNPDGSLQRQGGALPTLGNIFRWITFLDDVPVLGTVLNAYQHHDESMRHLQKQGVAKVGWVGGTALMMSQSCLAEIGAFDPSIFMYGEDVELCWRATQRHWDVALVDAGKVLHYGTASGTKKSAILGEIKGLLYLWQKYHAPFEQRLLRWVLRTGLFLRVMVFGILRQYGRQRIYQEALELVRQ